MKDVVLKGLVAGLAATAAIAMTLPSVAADHHHGHGRVVVRTHGHGGAVVRVHRFHAGDVGRLTVVERDRWHHGRWWQGTRHGRAGWWWFAGGIWYWYAQPVYPYPTAISAEAVYDYAPEGRSDDSWYYCENPQGYYPYVRSCNVDWKAVPIQPSTASAGDDTVYGEPPYEGGDDEDTGDEDDDFDDSGY